MKAIQIAHFGGPEVLKIQDVPMLKPEQGQALVRIKMSGVNFIDVYQRSGKYPVKLPYVPGLEGSGIVESVGPGVNNVKPGDRVAYVHAPGSYAEQALVKAENLILLPSELSFEQGAAFPLQGMTAHYLLHEFRKIQSQDIVLIHAAAGGMGLLLVQWAKHMKTRVLGTASTPEKAKIAKEAGADEVILYTEHDFASEVKRLTHGHEADLIIDGVGKTTFQGNLEAAALRGNIAIFGAASGPADPISPNAFMARSLTVSGGSLFNYLLTSKELSERAHAVIEGIQQQWLKLRIDQIFSLENATHAHLKLESRKTSGKLLLSTGN